jgi:hypothetical protein
MKKRTNAKTKVGLPKGWSENRLRRVLRHYEDQSEEAAVAEDEAAYRARKQTIMAVPVQLVPAVRKLIAKRAG